MSFLFDLGVVSQAGGKSTVFFEEVFPSLEDMPILRTPSQFILEAWGSLESSGLERDLRGKVFECLVAVLLIKMGVQPFSREATLALLPNVRFDLMMFPKGDFRSPIALSLKTSLRERYKQTDLEATLLKQTFIGASSYLITLEESITKRQSDLQRGLLMGIKNILTPYHPEEFNQLFYMLAEKEFEKRSHLPMFLHAVAWVEDSPSSAEEPTEA